MWASEVIPQSKLTPGHRSFKVSPLLFHFTSLHANETAKREAAFLQKQRMHWQFRIRQLSTENPLGLLGRQYPRDTLWGGEGKVSRRPCG